MFERISVPLEAVVSDANVLLSAIIGKAAQRVFSAHDLKVHVSDFNAREVSEYLFFMASRYGLPGELVDLRWRILPLIIHKASEYSGHFEKALADLKARDPEDAHALALARSLGLPLWSNDRHLARLGVPCYTTARLMKILDAQKNRSR
jgi:predicted nucleic acid-binding protein